MTGPAYVTMQGDELAIPNELFRAMREPRRLLLGGRGDDLFIARPTPRDRLRRPVVHRLREVVGEYARYIGPPRVSGRYRVANYHPRYYLLAEGDRTTFWRTLRSYHEHLPVEQQESNARSVSSWLASEVLGPLGPSFLELGCGAGRNLAALSRQDGHLALAGIEVNASAAALARAAVPGADVSVGDLYDVGELPDGCADVVFTSGVLMHVPHDRVEWLVLEMRRLARRAVAHFELHGPSHGFDFHRYPRDYSALYARLGLRHEYEVFPHGDFRSAGVSPFHHALLVSLL